MNATPDPSSPDRTEPADERPASLLRRLLRPRTPMAVQRPATWRDLEVQLSGTRLGLVEALTEGTTGRPSQPGTVRPGQPVSFHDADFRLDVVAKNVSFARASDRDPQRHALFDFEDGHVTLRMTPANIQTLLKSVADQYLRDFGVTITDAAVRFATPSRRELQADVQFTAKRRWVWGRMQLTGSLVVGNDFHARLDGLAVHGRGGIGRLLAAWTKPRMQPLEERQFSLIPPALAGIRPIDIEFAAGENLEIKIEFEGGSVGTASTKDQASKPAMGETLAAAPSRKQTTPQRAGRLDIYVIDTGWNEPAKQALDQHLKLFESLLAEHLVYVLSQQQSKETLQRTPALMGEDPILVLVDSDARAEKSRHGYGIRLCLGAMPQERLSDNLKMVLQIAGDRSRTTAQMIGKLRKECHKQGLDGAVEIVGSMIRPE